MADINGTAGNDSLTGTDGNDTIRGLGGYDFLEGGAGNDWLEGGDDEDYLEGGTGDDMLFGGEAHDVLQDLVGSGGHDQYFGENGDDELEVNVNVSHAAASYLLDGGGGNDRIFYGSFFSTDQVEVVGGEGNDDISVSGAQSADIDGGTGNDRIEIDLVTGTYAIILGEGVDTLETYRSEPVQSPAANVTVIDFKAGDSGDRIWLSPNLPGHPNPFIDGHIRLIQRGADTIIQEDLDGSGTEHGFLDSLVLTNVAKSSLTAFNFSGFEPVIVGTDGDNVIVDDAGNHTLMGFAGYDTMSGEDGNDRLDGGDGNDILSGGAGIDVLEGGNEGDLLDGGTGADQMQGGPGDDTYFVDNTADQAIENYPDGGYDLVRSSVSFTLAIYVDNLELRGTAAINGTGNEQDNYLYGNDATNRLAGGDGNDTLDGHDGNDMLDGGAGNDTLDGNFGDDVMRGGSGNDYYLVGSSADTVIETGAADGIDTVQVTRVYSYTLGSFVENLILHGVTSIKGTGNSLDNVITGDWVDNILDGGLGADVMNGGGFDDIYIVDNVLDRAVEIMGGDGGGLDLVKSSVTFTLGVFVEELTLTGTNAINGTGNELANILTGNSAANVLDGKGGADVMQGGAGNDTYVVDNVGDQAIEVSASHGIDTVNASVSFTLAAKLENLTLTGAGAINATGNAAANILTGNGAANVLNGAAGADEMRGGGGNDTYIVDNVLDQAIETSAAGGTDLVQSSASFTLGANVENLTLTGTAAINGTGNGLTNLLIGNTGANVLNGGVGADTMQGGAGNDTYVIDNAGDQAIEVSASHGVDTVQSSVSYTLAAKLENLTLTGTGSIDGAGNVGGNVITGNAAKNFLDGVAGSDTLFGGGGADRFVFANSPGATNIDTVLDFAPGVDKLLLDDAVFTALGAGALPAGALVMGSAATDANDRILYDAATGALFYDRDGTGAAAAVQFATLDNLPASLAASDFLVI